MNFKELEDKVELIDNSTDLFELWIEAHKVEDENSQSHTKADNILEDSFVFDGIICDNIKDFNGVLLY